MMSLRRVILALPLLLGVFFLVAFLSVRNSTPKKLNQFVLGSIGEPDSLNPILSTTTSASDVQERVFNSLIRYDENLEFEGDLARSWEISQHSRWFFSTEADAKAALENVLKHRDEWKSFSLGDASLQKQVLLLEFKNAGTAYREKLLEWIKPVAPRPVTFLTISLDTKKKFGDEKGVGADEMLKRFLPALEARGSDLAARVVYTWTGGSTSQIELPVVDEVEQISSICSSLLSPPEGSKENLGSVAAGEPAPALDEPEILFHLRPNVRWQDGKPCGAEDVLFTYQSLMSEEIASPRRSDFELVRDMTTPDSMTVRVLYKRPFSPALASWMMNILPSHILKGRNSSWWAQNFNRKPIGTGPFILDSWKTNESITLRKNKDYWEGEPHLDEVVIRFIPDPLAIRLSFETREVDVYGVEPFALGTMRKNPDYEIFTRPSAGYDYVGWNLKRPLFQDRRVREALAHAMNIPQIIKYVLYTQGIQSNGTFPPQMWFADPNLPPFTYDPKRAKELLAEAGWDKQDSDGILAKDGKRFEFTLITNEGNEVRKDVGVLVQQDLQRIGIKANIENYEWTVFIKKVDQQDFDACVLGWSLGYDYDQYQLWHSSQTFLGGLNFCSYNNPKLDKLLELARSEFDRNRVAKYCHEIQRIIYEDQPYAFLYVPDGATALHKGTFAVRRPDHKGGWIDEPIRPTKAGIGIYNAWWYRKESSPVVKEKAAP